MRNISKLTSICMLLFMVSFLNGCNTVRGFGEDVAIGGHEIQRAAS